MARPQNRKRQRADEPSRADTDPPAKKSKTRSEIELEAWRSWIYPPEFYDRLSKIELTRRALEELDRRTRTRRSHLSTPTRQSGLVPLPTTSTSKDLARFARHGGPDLRDLRGYPYPITDNRHSASQSSRSQQTKSTLPTSTLPTSATAKTKTKTQKTSPYNRDFDLHLTEHGVHPTYSSQKPDLAEVREALVVARPSLSPSKFSDGAFERFQESNDRAKDEDDVWETVMPTIFGPNSTAYFTSRNTVFRNLDPLTDGTIADAKPDFYDGAEPQELDRSIRNELAGHIVPSTMVDKPMAPNFFLEVKGPDGSPAVATRQARYDGAIGSRAIHSLQNYSEEEPAYNGNAYTFSSIYYGGALQLYAHHPTAPTTEGGRPEYHMIQVRAFGMTDTRETFIQGATAFRNTRDLAKRHRDNFVQEANARASHVYAAEPNENEIDEPVDPAQYIASQDADDKLQQHIAETSFYDVENSSQTPAVPHCLYTEDDSQEASHEPVARGDDPSMSFTSSFTSGFSTGQSHSKRSRPSLSPPSKSSGGSHTSKSRTRPSAVQRTAESSTPTTTGLVQSGPGRSHWVGTYGRRGKVYFRNLQGSEVKTDLEDWTEQIVDERECFYWEDAESGQTFWATELPKETKRRSSRR